MKRLRDAVRNKELPESTDLKVLLLFFRNTLFRNVPSGAGRGKQREPYGDRQTSPSGVAKIETEIHYVGPRLFTFDCH